MNNTSHGGRAHLHVMMPRLVHTDDLADLVMAQDAQRQADPR